MKTLLLILAAASFVISLTSLSLRANPIVSTKYAAGCCKFPAEGGNEWLDLTGSPVDPA